MDSAQDRATAAKAHGSGGGFTVAVRYLATTAEIPAAEIPAAEIPAAEIPAPARAAHGTPSRPDIGVDAGTDTGAGQVARARSLRRARAVAAAFAVYSGHNHLRRRPLRRPVRTVQRRQLGRGDALSVAEVAALAHLPTDEHVPGLRRAGAAAVAPPPQVPSGGRWVRPLGDADAVAGRPVGLAVPDARQHVWILGATGAGKSTLCVHGILADAHARRGAIVFDPKGDLVTDILDRLPAHARERTILIDPARPGRSGDWPCLNPLDPIGLAAARDAIGDAAVENVVSVFARVFSSAWGHRSEDLFRVACLTLRDRPGTASLSQIPELLGDDAVRARRTFNLDLGGRLARFWAEFDQLSDGVRAQISAPLLNKLRAVVLRPFAERLLCGPTTVDLPDVLDNGGLLLVRLPKGLLGEDTVRLIGSLLVAQVWSAALARAGQPEHARRDASLLIDECHNFLHLPYRIEDMLAEARGFRLSLTLAHQHLGQLTPPLRDGIAANARNKVFFALSPEDAGHLARHTLPELGAHDLAHLDGFHAAARLITDGAPARAFTLTTRPLPPAPRTSTPPAPTPNAPPRTPSRTPNRTPSRAPNTGHPPRRPGRPAPSTPDRFDPRLAARPHSPDPRSSGPRSSGPRSSGPRSPGPRAARPPQNPSPWR